MSSQHPESEDSITRRYNTKPQQNHRHTPETEIVARFSKNACEDVVVGFSTYKGNDLFTMRVVKGANGGEIMSKTKGIHLARRASYPRPKMLWATQSSLSFANENRGGPVDSSDSSDDGRTASVPIDR